MSSPIITSKENEVYEAPGSIHSISMKKKKGEEIEEGQKDEEEKRREEKEEKGEGERKEDGIVSWDCVGTSCFA